MFRSAEVIRTIERLEIEFQNARSVSKQKLFAKMASLEACGWIEETVDLILFKFLDRHKREIASSVMSEITRQIKKNYNFDYDENIRKNLVQPILGHINFRIFERSLDANLLVRLKSSLGHLKAARNNLAHTYIHGATLNLDAPKTTLVHVRNIKFGLKDFESKLSKIKFRI